VLRKEGPNLVIVISGRDGRERIHHARVHLTQGKPLIDGLLTFSDFLAQ